MATIPTAVVRIGNKEFNNLVEYAYVSDILGLGDPFTVSIPNPGGMPSANFPGLDVSDSSDLMKIKVGQSLTFSITDPNVNSGSPVQKLKGLVTNIERMSTPSGSVVRVTGADIGWHLQNNSVKPYRNFRGAKFGELVDFVIDPSWGFQTDSAGKVAILTESNDINQSAKLRQGRLNQGRTGAVFNAAKDLGGFTRIQTEIGQTPAELLILYAKRLQRLCGVSADGYLQIWKPDYARQTDYTFNLRRGADSKNNNIIEATFVEDLAGRFNDVICDVTRVTLPKSPEQQAAAQQIDPNAMHIRSRLVSEQILSKVSAPGATTIFSDSELYDLEFVHRLVFSESDYYTSSQALDRARWKLQRSQYDSWNYEISVQGHSQNGIMFEPNTLAQVRDDVNGINRVLYISAVHYQQHPSMGTRTRLTLKLPSLLGA